MLSGKINLFFRKSVFRKVLFSTVILVFSALLFIVGFTYNKVLSMSQAEFKVYSLESIKQIEHNVSSFISQMDTLTYTISTNETVQEYLNRPAEGFEIDKINDIKKIRFYENNVRYVNTETNTTFLVISGMNNELYTSSGYFANLDYSFNFNNNTYTERFKNNLSTLLYLGSHKSEMTLNNNTVFSMIRTILDASDNRLLGYLYFDIDYKVFNKLINSVVYSNNNDLQILDGRKVIYSTNSYNVLKSANSDLYAKVSSSNEGTGFISIKDVQYFFTYTTMNKTNWKIVSLHSMASYNLKAVSLIRFIIIISVILFIISATAAVLMSLAITKPIKNLTHLMKQVENDDFNVYFNTKSVDEIATMGNVFNSMIDRIRNLIRSIYKAKLVEKDAIIYALQSQINPHFLYNTLQSISNIAHLEGTSDITTMCKCLSSMFRYSIEGKRRFVMLYDEVTHINNYFYLLSIQHKDRLKYSVKISEDLLPIRVPRFILQPLVENSVSHGLGSMLLGGEVKVYAVINNVTLEISVEDNGAGMEDGKLKEVLEVINQDFIDNENLSSKYLALNNVNKRLVMNYGQEFALKIESKLGKGTKVTISIPIEGFAGGNHVQGLDS